MQIVSFLLWSLCLPMSAERVPKLSLLSLNLTSIIDGLLVLKRTSFAWMISLPDSFFCILFSWTDCPSVFLRPCYEFGFSCSSSKNKFSEVLMLFESSETLLDLLFMPSELLLSSFCLISMLCTAWELWIWRFSVAGTSNGLFLADWICSPLSCLLGLELIGLSSFNAGVFN